MFFGVFFVFYTEIQDGHQNWSEKTIFGKSRH